MTVAELAKRLNVSIPKLLDIFIEIGFPEVKDETHILTEFQVKRAILKHTPNNEDIIRPRKIKLEEPKVLEKRVLLKDFDNDGKSQYPKELADIIKSSFKENESSLLEQFKDFNSIPNLMLSGEYRKITGNSFGFFRNISHQNGSVLKYPVSYALVDDLFIASDELINGKRYLFEATIARRKERTKKANPFLLQAKSENIKEIIELSAISQELKIKQEKLEEINTYLEKAEEHFEEKKLEVEEKVSKVFEEKQAEANSIIEDYKKTINQKSKEIQTKEKELAFLKESVEETNNNLQKMENLITTLKDRVSLCRNLQFISEDDENKYLNLLTAKEYKPLNHLDFEEDFEKSFSKLSEHIHAYLFHKKNLIYTRYQIRNFLTLLRTHDLIVLSGLSGSGKTQIVKAFAEALGGVAKIIPVKPNWTSSDDLIGYYNPLQMSFLPTPFTEAIVEAISNPNQLYFICLDEMNLARAEYYFADFLSKLEERSKQPEIELYANHEEELFVSEFSTMLNLIESSILGKEIKSWQEFLDNKEARKKFFEMLGNTDKESMLQLHARMKRRLIDILKFPSTIRIPDNVRFIGAINVDETTHYFSPKILDRIHVVKFDNPLLYEEQVSNWFKNFETEKELLPVYVQPNLLSERKEFPTVNNTELSDITQKLKEINQRFLLPLNIDFGIRSIRQSLNYADLNKATFSDYGNTMDISLTTIIIQKIFPRFVFDGNDKTKSGKTKLEVVKELKTYLAETIGNINWNYEAEDIEIGKSCNEYLDDIITQAEINNSQFNFFA